MLFQILLSSCAASLSSAHFILHWPPTAGFDDDLESTSPCGSATVTVNSSSPQVQIDRFAIMIQNTHPQGEWMFRGTTDTQAPYNWTDITPVVNTTGIGDFCLDDMHAPSEFAGKAGVIQVVDNSVDGMLYQCAPVNFVTGSNATLGSACTNATGFDAVWTSLEDFDGTSDSSTSSTTMVDSSTMSATTSAASGSATGASATSSAAAAMITGVGSFVGGLGLLAAGIVL
ncbi:hypothetical protein LTR85_004837 [Meristemomyces frigidus]|nr:hypothetical protein LTR85_004837 [Meristemomyces frigidus]